MEISAGELQEKVESYCREGYRLVQICCLKEPQGDVPADHLEMHYTFDKDYELVDLKFNIAEGDEVSSITAVYPYAYLYENEIHDLFGVSIMGINIDFQGNLYKVNAAYPFNKYKGAPPVKKEQ